MTEQEIEKIKHVLAMIKNDVTELTRLKIEIEMKISSLQSMERILVSMLPTDDRINRLFS